MREKYVGPGVPPSNFERQILILGSRTVEAEMAFELAAIRIIAGHPEFRSFKSTDRCPEGFMLDEKGRLMVQKVCVTKDGKLRALRGIFLSQLDEEGKAIEWESRTFTDEYPI